MDEARNIYFNSDGFCLDVPEIQFAPNGVTCIWGESGSGKSTLLQLLAGLCQQASPRGPISFRVGDVDLSQYPVEKREIGYVFQDYGIFPHMTVGENILLAAQARGLRANQVETNYKKLSARLDLTRHLGAKSGHLSGGEMQRVALARALLIQPRVVLLDEPMSALDERLRDEARRLISELQVEYRVPFILVTHDIRDVRALAERLILLKEGRVLQSGKSGDVLVNPMSLEAARAVPENQILETGSKALVFKPWQGQLLPHSSSGERPLASEGVIVYRFSVNVLRAYDEGAYCRYWVKTSDGQGVWIYAPASSMEKDLDLVITREDIIEFDLRK